LRIQRDRKGTDSTFANLVGLQLRRRRVCVLDEVRRTGVICQEIPMYDIARSNRSRLAALLPAVLLLTMQAAAQNRQPQRYAGRLGSGSDRIRRENGKVYIWAGGGPPGSKSAKYFDFTGAPFAPEDLQFGIGKDRIRAIDEPYFVKPDDPRLLKAIPQSPYPDRRGRQRRSNDDILVIGYVQQGQARAYPVALLDRHELVMDRFGRKPVAVGW